METYFLLKTMRELPKRRKMTKSRILIKEELEKIFRQLGYNAIPNNRDRLVAIAQDKKTMEWVIKKLVP